MTGNEPLLRSIFVRFDYHLCKSFFDIRTDELFDIIVDFPDSYAALEDLRVSLQASSADNRTACSRLTSVIRSSRSCELRESI